LIAILFSLKNQNKKAQRSSIDATEARRAQPEATIIPRPVFNDLGNTQADLFSIYQQVVNSPSDMSLKPLWARN
jgi:hypothetical protein